MSWWKGSTFKECICKAMYSFSEDMSLTMKQKFKFVNISRGCYHDVTATVLITDYNSNALAV